MYVLCFFAIFATFYSTNRMKYVKICDNVYVLYNVFCTFYETRKESALTPLLPQRPIQYCGKLNYLQ